MFNATFEDLPRDEEDLKDLLLRLEELDEGYPFKTGDDTSTPEKYDIALLVNNKNAQTAEHLVSDIISGPQFDFSSELVLLSYAYKNPNTNPKYEFSRLSLVEQNFRDAWLTTRIYLTSVVRCPRLYPRQEPTPDSNRTSSADSKRRPAMITKVSIPNASSRPTPGTESPSMLTRISRRRFETGSTQASNCTRCSTTTAPPSSPRPATATSVQRATRTRSS